MPDSLRPLVLRSMIDRVDYFKWVLFVKSEVVIKKQSQLSFVLHFAEDITKTDHHKSPEVLPSSYQEPKIRAM